MPQHHRQFMIGPEPMKVHPDWQVETVNGCGILSYCPKLSVRKIISRGGAEYVLIGMAVQSDASRPAPVEELKDLQAGVADLTDSWAGRWILIADGVLQTDAAGMMGCMYSVMGGATCVSSSTTLLRTPQTPVFDDRILEHGVGLEWYIAPFSRYEGIRRLLPSQQLDLKTGRICAKRLFKPVQLTYEQALRRVENTLVTTVAALAKTSQSLWLPLTAGFDSRLLLAAVLRAGVKLRCYTQAYTGISHGDLTLPPKLARLAGFDHVLIQPGKFDHSKEAAFALHTGEQTADRDKEFLCRGQWDYFGETDLIIRGGGIEIGCPRASRYHFSASEDAPCSVPPVDQIMAEHDQTPSMPLVCALEEWRRWTEATRHHELDWRDRFYIEQRLGAWASSIEQALDLSPCTRVPVSSCARYMSSMLQVPDHIRRDSAHQVELIRRMAPELLAYPFNPKEPFSRRIPRAIRRRKQLLMRAISSRRPGNLALPT